MEKKEKKKSVVCIVNYYRLRYEKKKYPKEGNEVI